MCLTMTVIAAISLSIVLLAKKKKGTVSKSLSTTVLMFWSAALMWTVDSISCLMEEEPFLDISMEDTILGVIIVATGLAVFALLSFLERRGGKIARAKQ